MPRNPEEHIRAAVASGRIPKSRAEYWRQRGREGLDLAVLDTMAAVPGLGELAAEAAQDDEDQHYAALFGKDGTSSGDHVAASTPRLTDEQAYDRMFKPPPDDEPASAEYRQIFPTPEEQQAAVDAREAAVAATVAALSEDELWVEMGFDRKSSK